MSVVIKFIIALFIGAMSLLTYWCNRQENPVTGENQHISMTVDQEIALGLQAAPQMAAQYGGLHPDKAAAAKIKAIGNQLVTGAKVDKTPYKFDFHLLADEQTLNAFALPGGQIFITAGLAKQLTTDGQLAGVLAHEIGHVVARHSAEQLAKAQLTEGLSGAAAIAIYDPDNPTSAAGGVAAALIGQLMTLKFSREDELDADQLAVKFTTEAGYHPRSLIKVMEVLARAAGRNKNTEFFQTHPNPGNRIARIENAIRVQYGSTLPSGLVK